MINYTTARTQAELNGILSLQKQNLASALSAEESRDQGFVTVVHSPADLAHLNTLENHIIAKEDDKVIAYLLAMTETSKEVIPVLQPMFQVFEQLSFAGKKLSHYHYIVVGQVCIEKSYRGKGILDQCYTFYKERLGSKYDFALTEIDETNLRSLAAHKRIGFQELHRYSAPDGKNWIIVIWDWNNLSRK